MFKRLKQTVKEKTGNAQYTRYPAEVDAGIVLTTEMLKGLKSIDIALMNHSAPYRACGLTKLEKLANVLSKVAAKKIEKNVGKNAQAATTMCNAISKSERKFALELSRDFSANFTKKMISTEMKAAVKLIDDLKKRRLDKDAAAAEEYQPRSPEADAAYDAQMSLVQAEFANYPTYQQRHAGAIKKVHESKIAALTATEETCTEAKSNLV